MDEGERARRKEARDKVNNAPYAPLLDGNDALRASHALEYIAAQLWEIRSMLAESAKKDKSP